MHDPPSRNREYSWNIPLRCPGRGDQSTPSKCVDWLPITQLFLFLLLLLFFAFCVRYPRHPRCPRRLQSWGHSRCLDAFVVALGQACEGGRKRWYASTLELQLASREMCSAFRSVPTLHVRVDDRTPPTMWSSRESQNLSNPRTSKVCIPSRVPGVPALSLSWALQLNVLVERAAIELWAWSEFVELPGSMSAGTLQSAVWPKALRYLVLNTKFAVPVGTVRWPPNLQRLAFRETFNQPIARVEWLSSLQQLSFRGTSTNP